MDEQFAGNSIQLLHFILGEEHAALLLQILTGVEEVSELVLAQLLPSGDSARADAGHVLVEGGVGHHKYVGVVQAVVLQLTLGPHPWVYYCFLFLLHFYVT